MLVFASTSWFTPAPMLVFAYQQAGGLGLNLIHLISIPVTNTSVNPARSTGVAIFQGDWAISQLWLFWIAPIVGALLAGAVYRWFADDSNS
jgi:aquaporin Z